MIDSTTQSADGVLVAGIVLLVSVLAVGMGVFISGIRWITLDLFWQKWTDRCRRCRPFFEGQEDLICRYVQFHWHMAIAEIGLFVSWLLAPTTLEPWTHCLCLVTPPESPTFGQILWLTVITIVVVLIQACAGWMILNHAVDRAGPPRETAPNSSESRDRSRSG